MLICCGHSRLQLAYLLEGASLAPEVIDEDAEPEHTHDPKDQLGLELGQRNIELLVGHVPISVQLRTP